MSENKKRMTGIHLMIVAGCMLLQAVPYGIAQNVPPLFVGYLTDSRIFGFNLTQVGFIFTIGSIASALIAPFGGKFYAKMSTRLIMLGGILVSTAGMFMNAFANSIGMYYFANAVIQIGCVVFSGLGVPYLIGTWFDEKTKATALGVAFAGGSIGNFFLQPIFVNLLKKYAVNIAGLHKVYLWAAIGALAFGIVAIVFFIRDNRNAATVQHDNVEEEEANSALKGIGAKATRALPGFWILATGMLLVGMNISAQAMQYANYFKAINIPTAIIGLTGSTFAVACLIGNVGGGVLFSKLGLFHSANISFALQLGSAVVMLLMEFIHIPYLAFIWAALYGVSVFIYMSGPAVMIQGLFGMKDSSEILGLFSIFFAVGFSFGNVIFGIIKDMTGQFVFAWIFVIIMIVVGYLILNSAIKSLSKHNYAQMDSLEA